MIRKSPHVRSTFIAVASGNIRTGARNVRATISFARNVVVVASQISLWVFLLDVSCAMWMPSASENASDIATVRIPPMTASFREVAAFSPIMTPSVVMTPEVRPNAIPVLWDGFISS